MRKINVENIKDQIERRKVFKVIVESIGRRTGKESTEKE
jgi:hypothetical protein